MTPTSLRSLRIGHRSIGDRPVWRSQTGLTLVELLVALVISTVIAIAAVSALIVSRRGFSTVDAAAQLRDNVRFSTDLIQRLVVQAGYEDAKFLTTPVDRGANPDPNISGFNNAIVTTTNPATAFTARTAGSVGYGSDVLVLRYQAGETFPGSGVSDNTMIDCAGKPAAALPVDANDRLLSVFYVDISEGEPTLMCITAGATAGTFVSQPIVRGVENFQVLYGVDGVVPNTAPVAGAASDSIADRYLRADQMVVSPADPVGTNANWRRLRSIRIGMVIRGPAGTSQDTATQTFYPLGQGKNSATGTLGSAMSAANTLDPATVFTPTPDTRLRQTVTFTIHLRNEQGL